MFIITINLIRYKRIKINLALASMGVILTKSIQISGVLI